MRTILLASSLLLWTGVAPAGTLHELAASPDHADEVRKALEAGADPNVADAGGKTPLEIAATAGNREIVEVLLKGGANIDEPGHKSRPPLAALAANYGWADTHGLSERLVATAKLLLERGADVNAPGRLGWTPLILASANGNTELVRLLLQYHPDVDTPLPTGYTALHQAAARGKDGAVRLLVEAGADITLKSGDGMTALELARHYHRQNVIDVLEPLQP